MNFQQATHTKALTRLLRELAQEIIIECNLIDHTEFGLVEASSVLEQLNWIGRHLGSMNTSLSDMGQKIIAAGGPSQKRREKHEA